MNGMDKEMLESVDGLLATRRETSDGAGAKPVRVQEKGREVSNYSLEGLNIKGKIPLPKIINAVRRFRDGTLRPVVDRPRLNILLSGVPGSGKTAFVRYLAQEVGAPLKSLKASDLLSKWIGESEKKLATAFKVATEENAILFLDEIDSFLQDRSGATHAWEVTAVNELLQQMEQFEGVLVGATNLTSHLDRAVMRRFTFKLELDYLTGEGKRIFFDRYFGDPLTAEERARLDAIDGLAPGDFRTVKEELFYVCENETNEVRLSALEAEVAMRKTVRPAIGFSLVA